MTAPEARLSPAADTLLVNADVLTLDANGTRTNAIAIHGESILAVRDRQ